MASSRHTSPFRLLLLLGLGARRTCEAYFVSSGTAARRLGQPNRPFCIGVAGGTASGKSTVVEKIVGALSPTAPVAVITQDCFYKQLDAEERALADAGAWNFDHPNAFDFESSLEVMRRLYSGAATPVSIPDYDFKTHSRLPSEHDTLVYRPQVVIFEGILALYDERLRSLFDLKVFVDAEADIRLARRIRRDMESRGRDLAGILAQYENFVKPSFDTFIHPTKRHADIVVPRGGDNAVAIDLLAAHISGLLPPTQHEGGHEGGHAARNAPPRHSGDATELHFSH